MFIVYCLTIVAFAGIMGRATESLTIVMGPRIGGLLNATFGNAVELIISVFSLKAGLIGIVLASLTGSVIRKLLLVGWSFILRRRTEIQNGRNLMFSMPGIMSGF